jgi:hypothetical protein
MGFVPESFGSSAVLTGESAADSGVTTPASAVARAKEQKHPKIQPLKNKAQRLLRQSLPNKAAAASKRL